MRLLVPLPFDLSSLAHGRNLRIAHLLRELNHRCDLSVIASNDVIAGAARNALPDVSVTTASPPADASFGSSELPGQSYRVRRALSFVGWDPCLTAAVAAQAASADAVLGFDLPSVVCLLAVQRQRSQKANSRPRIICDLIDDPWLTWQSAPVARRWSPAGIKTAFSIRIIRSQVLGTFDALTAVAPRDARSLTQATGLDVTVCPNGVQVDAPVTDSVRRESLVVFTGAMNFPPNEAGAQYLVRHIWPRVLRCYDKCRQRQARTALPPAADVTPTLAIVGANPTGKVMELAQHKNVVVTGGVKDLRAWLHRARVAVAPMVSGCGIKNKILEACAAGCPVISTPLGSEGLPTGADNGVMVAGDPGGFADEIAAMLTDPLLAHQIGRAGHAMVRARFSWPGSAETLLAVVTGTTDARAPEAQPERRAPLTFTRDKQSTSEEAPSYATS